MKDKLATIAFSAVFLVGLGGGAFSIYYILDRFHCPDFISSFVGLVYICAYALIFGRTSIGSKSAEEQAYSRGFADGQTEQEERNLLDVAGAARSQYQRGYNEGYAAGVKDAQAHKQ